MVPADLMVLHDPLVLLGQVLHVLQQDLTVHLDLEDQIILAVRQRLWTLVDPLALKTVPS